MLTARESEVLQGIADGLLDRQIGERLCISPLTARAHARNILAKLSARTRAHAVLLAVRAGLLRPENADCTEGSDRT